MITTKQTGIILIAVAIALAMLIAFYTPDLIHSAASECGCSAAGGSCPHANNLPVQSYLGIGIVAVLAFLSYSLIKASKQASITNKEIVAKVSKLLAEEKSIYEAISAAEGAMLQSELVDKTNLSKVKVTRVLDKLEGKGLLERRRRGMTNLVILKR